jgi:hypothetical protein
MRGIEFLGGRVPVPGPTVLSVHGDGHKAMVSGSDFQGEFSRTEFNRDGLAAQLAELMNDTARHPALVPSQPRGVSR